MFLSHSFERNVMENLFAALGRKVVYTVMVGEYLQSFAIMNSISRTLIDERVVFFISVHQLSIVL